MRSNIDGMYVKYFNYLNFHIYLIFKEERTITLQFHCYVLPCSQAMSITYLQYTPKLLYFYQCFIQYIHTLQNEANIFLPVLTYNAQQLYFYQCSITILSLFISTSAYLQCTATIFLSVLINNT